MVKDLAPAWYEWRELDAMMHDRPWPMEKPPKK